MKWNRILVAGLAFVVGAGVASAQGRRGNTPPGASPQAGRGDQAEQSSDAARRMPPPEEKSSVTHHSAHIGGQQITYTATAANYVIKADDGTPKASFLLRGLHEG